MKKGVFTAPTTNGTDTVISGLNNPKAIMLWTTKDTAAGGTDTHAEFYWGCATYDGGVVQAFYASFYSADAGTASDTARGFNSDPPNSATACLKGFSSATPAVEFDCRLVSMNGTSITLDWFDAPATAIKVHYIIWDADDGVTGAVIGQFAGSVAAATQDVSLPSGWGNADVICFGSMSGTTNGQAATGRFTMAWDNGTERMAGGIWETDGSANMACSSVLKANGPTSLASISSFDGEATWDKANDPTDGFRLAWGNQLAAAHLFSYLAMKGTVQTKIGTVAAPTAGSPPVNADFDAGFVPSGALFFSDGLASHSTVDTASADLMYWMMGATDGTNEGMGGVTQDDGNGTSFTGRVHSETKSFARYHSPGAAGAPTLDSEADGSFTGNTVRLSFNDIDSAAAVVAVVAFGAGVNAYALDCQPGSFAVTGAVTQLPRGLFVNSEPGAYTLTGFQAATQHGFFVDAQPGSYGVTGVAASVLHDAFVNAQPGAYTFTGVQAAVGRELALTATPGSYAITGADASPLAGRMLSADAGAYTFTGFQALTAAGRVVVALPGSFTIAGFDADLVVAVPQAYVFDAQPGSFAVTGFAADLVHATPGAYVLGADPGAFAITGAVASVLAAHHLAAEPGAIVVTGVAAAILATRFIQLEPGQFAVVGFDGEVMPGRVIALAPGVFAISGAAATFLAGQFATPARTSRTRSDVRSGITSRGNGDGRTRHRVGSGRTGTST